MGLTRITSDGITDGTIVNADINGSAAIAGSKLNTNFGSSGMTATGSCSFGNITISNVAPKIFLTDSDTDSDFSIRNMHGVFGIHDQTNSADRLTITSDGHIRIPADDKKLQIGASQDLEIYHSGGHSFINNATGNLAIRTTTSGASVGIASAGGEQMASFIVDGATELYYDNSKKFNTTATGATITGTCNMTSLNCTSSGSTGANFTVGGDLNVTGNIDVADNVKIKLGTGDDFELFHNGSRNIIGNSTAQIRLVTDVFRVATATGDEVMMLGDLNGAVELYYDGSKKLATTTDGIQLFGNGYADFPDLGRIRMGASYDLAIYHDGTNSYINESGTGDLIVKTNIFRVRGTNDEAIITGAENGNVALYYDNSKKFETTSSGVQLPDSSALELGDRSVGSIKGDLRLYHDGSNSYIDEVGSGNLFIRNGSNTSIFCQTSGTVELYHNGSKKLETTSSGVQLGGDLDTNSNHILLNDTAQLKMGASNDFIIRHNGTDNTLGGNATTKFFNPLFEIFKLDGTKKAVAFNADSGQELYHNNSKKFETTSGGVTVTGRLISDGLDVGDSESLRLGNNYDLQIFHDGTDSFIKNDNGQLILRVASVESAVVCKPNGAVELYHDNSKKFETTSGGVTVTGTVTATSFSGDGSNLSGIASFASGTVMLFNQTNAPTGWTKSTVHNNKALRVVSGTASSGGGNGFTTAFNSSFSTSGGSVSNHTLSVSQIPSHNHTFSINNEYNQLFYPNQGIVARGENKSGIDTYSTSNTGSGSSHNHGFSNPSINLNVAYIDVIVASKD